MGDEVSRPLKLSIVTGSRADYGHLRSLVTALKAEEAIASSLIVTGSHLSSRFGNTVNEIEKDAFPISARIPLPLDDDSPSGLSSALGSVISQTAELLHSSPVDGLVVYGDRWEMFGAAVAATLSTIPLVHIGGGDITEGAYDESFRHAMTKMSHLHFVTHEDARRRVLLMGEDPAHVFNVGSLAIDSLKAISLLSRDEFETQTGFKLQKSNILVTYHPTTLEGDAVRELEEVLRGLKQLPDDVGIIMTQPSLDAGSLKMMPLVEGFIKSHPHSTLIASLGQQRYLSAISLVDAVVGNSSSGLYEVPSFKKPTINIGDRQGGRLKASSVIDVPTDAAQIANAIVSVFGAHYKDVVNPYGDGHTASKIVEILRTTTSWRRSVKKKFYLPPPR